MDTADFHAEIDALLREAINKFATWAQENWGMKIGEADTLTEPSPAPREYERGYNEALQGLPDAAALWLDEYI